jgi:CheY-like chemotaxis protein
MGYAPKRLLVVEDEHLIASLIVEQLAEIGCDVLGPAYTISEARPLALAAAFDAALVDWNMRGTVSTEIANILSSREIPFLVVTGYAELPVEARTAVFLNKPFTREQLKEAV